MWKHACYSAFISSLFIGLVFGCVAALPQPTSADGEWASRQWPDTTTHDLVEGRSLYARKCSGCHTLYQPKDYNAVSWKKMVDEMGPKSGINANQADLILKYILTTRRDANISAVMPINSTILSGDHSKSGP